MWYKSGNSQVDFDLDHNECQRIAEEVSRQATITGGKINLEVFNTSYNNCLFPRDWMAGIGAYYPVEKNKQTSLDMTCGIPSQDTSPQEGLRLTKTQKLVFIK